MKTYLAKVDYYDTRGILVKTNGPDGDKVQAGARHVAVTRALRKAGPSRDAVGTTVYVRLTRVA